MGIVGLGPHGLLRRRVQFNKGNSQQAPYFHSLSRSRVSGRKHHYSGMPALSKRRPLHWGSNNLEEKIQPTWRTRSIMGGGSGSVGVFWEDEVVTPAYVIIRYNWYRARTRNKAIHDPIP
ncbi:hypothetical protein TNCV_3826811 [Trichonephila clavipes]|nr:hypothetical protein TNCV_3826811 [Trichonephila clavipes]